MSSATLASPALRFNEIGLPDIDEVGGKCANLGELIKAGLPFAPGFSTRISTFHEHLAANGLDSWMYDALDNVDRSDTVELGKLAQRIQDAIISLPLPREIEEVYRNAYLEIGDGKEVHVAVRSSANFEDGDGAAAAGMQETETNVCGFERVVAAIKRCWASLYGLRAIEYRIKNKISHRESGIALAIQMMVEAEISGIAFTQEPVGIRGRARIETVFGLGDRAVGGKEKPEFHVLNFANGQVIEHKRPPQSQMLVRNPDYPHNSPDGNLLKDVSDELNATEKYTPQQLNQLWELMRQVERHYGRMMDIEFARGPEGKIYIIQARPAGFIEHNMEGIAAPKTRKPPILSGEIGAPGAVTGPAYYLRGKTPEMIAAFPEGAVLIADETDPDCMAAIKKCIAMLTRNGGVLCHAAITSRENLLPCIVGVDDLLETIKDGDIITIDANFNAIYVGDEPNVLKAEAARQKKLAEKRALLRGIKTKTQVYLILANPNMASRFSDYAVDGVGLIRMEEILADIGEHPESVLESGRREWYVNHVFESLCKFYDAFPGMQLVIRSMDFKQKELSGLKNAAKYEDRFKEANSMIGVRGPSRYQYHPDVYAMEVEAYWRIYQKYGRLTLMTPFVRDIEDIRWVSQFHAHPFRDRPEISLVRGMPGYEHWMMAELPDNAFCIDEYCEWVDGFSIGSNDLAQMTKGADRDNKRLRRYLDETSRSMMIQYEMIIKGARRNGKKVGFCGQAVSNNTWMAPRLIEWGATSLSVTPDQAEALKERVVEYEREKGIIAA